MRVYVSEKDQIADIKEWFAKYGFYITFAILFVISYIFVSNYMNNSRIKASSQASELFEELIKEKDETKKIFLANDLVQKYPKTIYGNAAGLLIAKNFADNGNGNDNDAISKYNNIYQKTASWDLIKFLAFSNMIVLETKDDPMAAYEKFESNYKKFNSFEFLVYDLQGDLLVKNNKLSDAVKAYGNAQKSVMSGPLAQQYLANYLGMLELKQSFYSYE